MNPSQTKDMNELNNKIDELLARMEQTDPYHSRRNAIKELITEQVRLELKELIEKQELVSGEWGGMVVVPIDHLLNRIAQLKDTPLKEGNHE